MIGKWNKKKIKKKKERKKGDNKIYRRKLTAIKRRGN